MSTESPPEAVLDRTAREPAVAPATAAQEHTRAAAHGLLWAAPIALCIAAVAGWLWLQAPEAGPAPPQQPPATTTVADPPDVEATAGANKAPDSRPAEALDDASTAADPVAAEHQAAKGRYERAYRAYTVLITEGGSGSVIAARDEYAAAYADLKRIEAAHPEYAK